MLKREGGERNEESRKRDEKEKMKKRKRERNRGVKRIYYFFMLRLFEFENTLPASTSKHL